MASEKEDAEIMIETRTKEEEDKLKNLTQVTTRIVATESTIKKTAQIIEKKLAITKK